MNPLRVSIAIVALAVIGLPGPIPASAGTPLVPTRFDDPPPGTCEPNDCSLREAVATANETIAPDTIILHPGTYLLTIEGDGELFSEQGNLDVLADLTIVGAGAGATTIAGAWPSDPDTILTVDNSASLTVNDLTIRDGEGGSSYDGGGLLAGDGTTVTLTRTVVTSNAAAGGGGIENHGDLTITDSTISDNSAVTPGGGIFTSGPLAITNSTISGNSSTGGATGGGGGLGSEGSAELTNVTVSGNSAANFGGGISNSQGTITLNNSTITGNTADSNGSDSGDGGGMFQGGTDIILRNTVVAGNIDNSSDKEPDCSGNNADPDGFTSQGHNLIGDTTGCPFTPGPGDVSNVDPMVGPLADNGGPTFTHALLSGSPAIDAGDPGPPGSGGTACAATDQRGLTRNCDIGAYELVLCREVPVNRIGTDGNDVLTGTDGADGFLAQGGNDRVTGLGGNDAACLGAGNDRASGGGGRDTLLGEAGKDRLNGGGGKDLLICGPGKKETGKGGPGKDRAKKCEKGKA